MKDLQSSLAIWIKGWLFLLIGVMAAGILLVENPSLRTGLLIAACVWGFCRFYFFAFYVIERWVDPSYKFSGLGSFLAYAWKNKQKPNRPPNE